MSDLLNEADLKAWTDARAAEAARVRPELFTPLHNHPLLEIKERLLAIIAEIDKAMERTK